MYPESWTYLLIMLIMWMPSCILQVASILFFMNPFVVIVDIFFNCFLKLLKGLVFSFVTVIHFFFHPSEECFHYTLIIAITLPRHRLNNIVSRQYFPIIGMLVLPPVVRVKYQSSQIIEFLKYFF